MATDITVPTLGESVSEATVAQWLKKQGDKVEMDEAIVELETDKVTLEVNAAAAGTIGEVLVQEGDTVEPGAILGKIEEGEVAPAAASQESRSAKTEEGRSAKSGDGEARETAEAAPVSSDGGAGGEAAEGEGEDVEVPVPTLGESVSEATVAQWLKQPGDSVAADEAIAELETDKVTLEVNAPAAGTLKDHAVAEGETVTPGAILARITKGGKAAAKPAAEPAKAQAEPAAEPQPASEPGPAEGEAATAPEGGFDPNRAPRTQGRVTRQDLESFLSDGPATMRPEDLSPAVRKAVQDHNVDPTRVAGTGVGGRLTKQDVLDFVEGKTSPLTIPSAPAREAAPSETKPAAPTADAPAEARAEAPAKREERVKMSRLRQTIAKRLKEAQNTAAMLTTFNEIDMTAVNALRARYKEDFEKAHGTRLGMTCFFAKAIVQALKENPAVNARIEGDEMVYSHHYDIGMAVSTPQGLMVPVVREVDKKSMAEIEDTLRELGKRGRDGKLKMEEMQGATFSMTNGGVFGSLLSTPILNPPQSGILGMHKIQDRPMAVNGKVEIRPMMYVALSYDHRIIDGREAVTFLVRVKECLEDPARLLLQM